MLTREFLLVWWKTIQNYAGRNCLIIGRSVQWVDFRKQLCTHNFFIPCSIHSLVCEGIVRAEACKNAWAVVGRVKVSLVSERKKKIKQPSDAKAITYHLPPVDRCLDSLQVVATLKRQFYHWMRNREGPNTVQALLSNS